MDINVSGYKEVAGPLGGLSVEYIIHVNTSHRVFKTNLQSDAAIVSFTVSKTFKELEYFYKKIRGKYPGLNLPNITLQNSPLSENKDERQRLADQLMKFIASEPLLSSSSLLSNFLDYQPLNRPVVEKKPSSESPKRNAKTEKELLKPKSENMFTNNSDEEETDDLFVELKHTNDVGANSTSLFCEIPLSKPQRGGESLLFEPQDLGETISKYNNDLYVPLNDKLDVDQDRLSLSQSDDNVDLLHIDSSLSDILGELELQSSKSKSAQAPKPTSGTTVPVPSPRPRVHPSTTQRPVPPPRTTLASSSRPPVPARKATVPSKLQHVPTAQTSSSGDQMDSVDILKYIQCEEDAQKDDLSLF